MHRVTSVDNPQVDRHSTDDGETKRREELAREFSHRGIDVSKLSEYWWLNTPTDETKIIPQTPKELKALKETMNDMEARVRRFLAEIEALPESTLAVVCHGDFISWLTSTYPANCAIVKTTLRQLWAQRQ
ncbi:unnamed protein product [Aphanomyces euteiches]